MFSYSMPANILVAVVVPHKLRVIVPRTFSPYTRYPATPNNAYMMVMRIIPIYTTGLA